MIPAHDVLGAALLAAPCLYFLILTYANITKAPWLQREQYLLKNGTSIQRAAVSVAAYGSALAAGLLLLGGIQYSFGIRLLDVAGIVTLVIVHPIATSFLNRKAPPVGDDWLLWDLRTESNDSAR